MNMRTVTHQPTRMLEWVPNRKAATVSTTAPLVLEHHPKSGNIVKDQQQHRARASARRLWSSPPLIRKLLWRREESAIYLHRHANESRWLRSLFAILSKL